MSDEQPLSHSIYGIDRWSKDLLSVLPNGDVALCDPAHPEAAPVSLPQILEDLHERGIASPLVLRVKSFLEAEIQHLNDSFAQAIAKTGYRAPYRGVFPIKVKSQKNNFPERGQRKLKWFSPKKAAQKVAEPELKALILGFDPRHL